MDPGVKVGGSVRRAGEPVSPHGANNFLFRFRGSIQVPQKGSFIKNDNIRGPSDAKTNSVAKCSPSPPSENILQIKKSLSPMLEKVRQNRPSKYSPPVSIEIIPNEENANHLLTIDAGPTKTHLEHLLTEGDVVAT